MPPRGPGRSYLEKRRRDFLDNFSDLLGSLARTHSPAVAMVDDLYLNRRLGFAFRRPPQWHFNDVLEMGEVAAGQVLALGSDLGTWFTPGELTPLVSVSEQPLRGPVTGFSPAFSVFIDPRTERDVSAEDVAAEDAEILADMLPDFTLESPAEAQWIADTQAARYTAEFRFEHPNLSQPVPVRMQLLYILQSDRALSFRLYDAPAIGLDRRREFRGVRASIHVA